MVKLFKLHKFFGLLAGLVLLILGVSGFFLDHKQWSFLYTTTFTSLPQSAYKTDKQLFDAYYVDPQNTQHTIVGGKRGIFESFDDGKNFKQISSLQCLGIRSDEKNIFVATNDGIYTLDASTLSPFALGGNYISAISLSDTKVVAIIEKHTLVTIQRQNPKELSQHIIAIDSSKLQDDIKLSRFVRDLHYGRGYFDGNLSLYINDYGAIVLSLLALSGYFIWFYIHKKKKPKVSRKLIKWHANWFAVISLIPLLILAVTGVFLDHSHALSKFMKSITIPNAILPPVYSTLQHDIWSVDYDGKTYRIGNRYGVYKSTDLTTWEQDSKGLAYRMFRHKEILYVSGMGAPNRIYDGEWKILKGAPHMFRDLIIDADGVNYFSPRSSKRPLPTFEDATLYALMMTLHDGTFFASWWVWVNDFVCFALVVLGVTGTLRWREKKRTLKQKQIFS